MLRLLPPLSEILRSRDRNGTRLAAIAAALLWLAPAPGHAASFTASLDRDTITLGESATLSLAFSGGQPRNVPALPDIPNLQFAYGGNSSSFNFENGQTTSTVSYNFSVTPRQPGDYAIPALTADVGGQRLASQPLLLKVLKPTAPPPEAVNSGSQLAFLKLVLPRQEIYAGETIAAQLQLYLHSRIQGAGQFQLTAFPADGFNVGKMIDGQRRQVQVGNAVYTVIPYNVALTAIKAGPVTLGPVTCSLIIELPSANPRRDVFDPFGMFSRREQKQITVASEAANIQLLPLPRENRPANFNGAVGHYTMTVTAGPTNVAAGDPITVRVQISGRGSLDSLNLPDQPAWHEFKTFPPTTKVETSDPLGLQGVKTFEQIITPENADIKALPPISFSFFDPDQKAFRTLSQPAIPLTVRPGGSAAPPTVITASRQSQNNLPIVQDIVPNKQRLGALVAIAPPLAQQPWFLALQGLPVLAFISAALWRKRAESLAHNPRLRRQRQVARVVRAGLDQLRQAAAAKKSEEFFATLFHLLQEQLGERLDLPATAITEAVIEERLRPRGVPESTLAPVQELFQTCNLARYAPIKSSQELAAIIPKVEAVLRQLQALEL